MGNWYSADHISKDHIHTDITCNTEEPQRKFRFGMVSNSLLDFIGWGGSGFEGREVIWLILSHLHKRPLKPMLNGIPWAVLHIETMSLREMGPQLKLPINVKKGSMPLQCNTYFPQILAI